MGALHMSKIKDHALKLKRIYDRVSALIDTTHQTNWRWRHHFLAKTCSPCSN